MLGAVVVVGAKAVFPTHVWLSYARWYENKICKF